MATTSNYMPTSSLVLEVIRKELKEAAKGDKTLDVKRLLELTKVYGILFDKEGVLPHTVGTSPYIPDPLMPPFPSGPYSGTADDTDNVHPC